MRYILVTCFLVVISSLALAEHKIENENPDITKLEVVELSKIDSDSEETDSQIKRDSGYSYSRPATKSRLQFGQTGYRGRIVSKGPTRVIRPFDKYGPPNHQNSPSTRPGTYVQHHRDQSQHQGHSSHRHQGDHSSHGLVHQEIPSPIRNLDFVEPSPIASQNSQPFGSNTANYLPPVNQKLPGYASVDNFSPQRYPSNIGENLNGNSHSSDIVHPQNHQISDATLFLTENAQAIQQLYGAVANDQDFAPNNNDFNDQNAQLQNPNGQSQNFESTSLGPEVFHGPLPSYASGTLNPSETLERIQSLEKDRLIAQLRQALAQQTRNAESVGRYAESHGNYPQDQGLPSAVDPSFPTLDKPTIGTSTSNTGNVGFGQTTFLPGTTTGPTRFPLGYGLTTTTAQTPITTTITTTTSTAPSSGRPNDGTKVDGTSQIGATLPAPDQPAATLPPAGFPLYGGFVPTYLTGTNFLTNVPTYGTGFFNPGTVTSVQSAGSSPTHFGIPIPSDQGHGPAVPAPSSPRPTFSPALVGPATSTTTTSPSNLRPGVVGSPPLQAIPVQPILPVAPLHPVSTALRPANPPALHPTYGLQAPVINPLLYKPLKPVYPVYYYQNVAYHQLHKPTLPTYPWSYAPSYGQAKAAQIWK